MDITTFTIGNRDAALLIGDYNAYRRQLSRQLLALRKRLGRATPKGAKYTTKAAITAEDIGKNHEYAHILLLTAERAWAHAMYIKSTHSEDNAGKGITGQTRTHIVSRLNKAAKAAKTLEEVLQQTGSAATDVDWLEAEAYRAHLSGSEQFEKQAEGNRTREEQSAEGRWDPCLRQLATARVIYATLLSSTGKDIFRDILANSIDPTIRYAAYQARLPRSIAISSVALRNFPKDNTRLVDLLQKIDPNALSEQTTAATPQNLGAANVPNDITWRGRKANIVDAAIGQALAAVTAAEPKLNSVLASTQNISTRDKAGAYDDVLIASQDAADATRRAIEELEKERVDEGDARMQDLRVTSLAVNYALISWRVGRNRVLIGNEDGRIFEEKKAKRPKRKQGEKETGAISKEEARGSKLARLRERLVLYDATLQSIDSIKDLRGAMRDEAFVREIDGKRAYFHALRCLNIAISHTLLSNHANALALLQKASGLATECMSSLTSDTPASHSAPTLDISTAQAEALQTQLKHLVYRHQALCDLHKFHENAAIAVNKNMASAAPLVLRLNDFPTPGVSVDLKNLVTYPPKLEPIPVKPLFFDVAWNYIDYPGRAKEAVEEKAAAATNGDVAMEDAKEEPKKRGWFGFGGR